MTARNAMQNLNRRMTDRSRRPPIPFDQFLNLLAEDPTHVLRNVFQVLHDMVQSYLGIGVDEYSNDPESIHYVKYDCSRLFEVGADRPFFADRLFANRFVNAVDAMSAGAQQNKIYVFKGPPGCGKSTFLNNLLKRFEAYMNTDEGTRYEVIWRLDPSAFGPLSRHDSLPLVERLAELLEGENPKHAREHAEHLLATSADGMLEIPCPCHDHPILLIPRDYREKFFIDLFGSSEFRRTLLEQREYSWVLKDKPCTFCSSLYRTLLNTLKNAEQVHKMIYSRPYRFNRRLGEGISVFNPGDPPPTDRVLANPALQRRLNALLKNDTEVQYLYSRYAKTNNGVYALMDVKGHNVGRFSELHNIISEGLHKVEDIEENVSSLLFAVMNPEDQENIKEFRSFSDRIAYINVPYVLDVNTEVSIYRHTFGSQIEQQLLPRVLANFARIIISTRMNRKSEALLEWIGDPKKYSLYCDDSLLLLKMEIYAGVIPAWLSEEDRRRLTAARRRRIISESDREGARGISGRDSIRLFNEFYSSYHRQDDKPITMSMLKDFFEKSEPAVAGVIPRGFVDSLVQMYNYAALQEVKESLYYYNEKQISRDILNYLFAVNFEPPTEVTCAYTGERLEITDEYLENMERRFLGAKVTDESRNAFRVATQREYTSQTLTQEMMVENREITSTGVYNSLRDRYVRNLKEKALDPFLANKNFRRAIKDYGTKEFRTYDRRIRDDIRYLIRNLRRKFGYTENGAREICIYVIDNDLSNVFSEKAEKKTEKV